MENPWQRLRASVVDGEAWLELARRYHGRGLDWQAGYAARQAVRCQSALGASVQALGIPGWSDAASGDGLLGRADLPDARKLAEDFSAMVRDFPEDWLSWLYLARLWEMPALAVDSEAPRHHAEALERARQLEIIPGETLHWMGVWRLGAGDAQGAVRALSALVDNSASRSPRYGSLMFLGEALLRVGNVPAAEAAFTRASHSPNPDFLLSLARRVYTHNYWQEAIGVLQKALGLRPNHVPSWLALAKIQSETYLLGDCRASLQRLRELDPKNAEAALLEAGLMGRMGDARAHLAALQHAYESGGDPLSRLASSVAMTSLYHDGLTPQDVAALHRRLCAPIEASVKPKRDFSPERDLRDSAGLRESRDQGGQGEQGDRGDQGNPGQSGKSGIPGNPRQPGRRLRIGYVSGDFHRQHPVNIFMLPVLLRHDHTRFEICIYHTGSMHDEYTRQARASADRWLEAAALDDKALQQAILADGIDVLVDLAGHTSTHRLGLFAMRAAPVQATFLGYPHSTGLSTIDWIIGDATVSPAGHADLFSEGIAQMPASVFCWAPVDDYPLPAARAAEAAPVFGSFNNAMKLSPRTVSLWAAVLRAVPGSILLLKAPSLRDPAVQQHLAARFAREGIEAQRLQFRGPTGLEDMMQEYGDVDIALDPTPYNGGTTTLQALWMGVPVVTLAGGNFVGRMGTSFLRTLGEPGWVAEDEAGYVAKAAALARDVVALRGARAQLRDRMARSPLCDIAEYVKQLEDLYRRMWHFSGVSPPQRLLAAVPEKVGA